MKIIHQIYITDNNELPSEYIQDKINKLKSLYSDYEYFFYNKEDIEKILIDNFSQEVIKAFKKIKPYAFKCDLARWALLYLYGGCYWDISIFPEVRLEFNNELVLIKGDQSNLGSNGLPIIDQGFIFCKNPKNKIVYDILNNIVKNINSYHYGEHPLDITGPITVGKIIETTDTSNIKFGKTVLLEYGKAAFIDELLFFNYKPKFAESDLSKLGAKGTNNYAEMWFDKNVFIYPPKMKHYYQNIQNWFDYEKIFNIAIQKAQDGAKFVEIGVWKGGSTAYMGVEIFNSEKNIDYDAIDTFEGSLEHGDVSEWLFKEATQNLKPLIDLGIVNLIKDTSLNAVNKYENESIDFCFIDGSHEYEDVKADIIAYLPKIKKGGIIAGHDYSPDWPGVVKAVDEIFGNNKKNINNSWIFYKIK